jgi:hypothetical protein
VGIHLPLDLAPSFLPPLFLYHTTTQPQPFFAYKETSQPPQQKQTSSTTSRTTPSAGVSTSVHVYYSVCRCLYDDSSCHKISSNYIYNFIIYFRGDL